MYLAYFIARTLSLRVSIVAAWVERNICALSVMGRELAICPLLICPEDATLLGYPWVLLPNGTDSVQGRGFHPVRVTQWPPPETPLWRDTTTHVVITAYDAWGIPRNCTWYAIVPPLVELGIQTVSVRNGTFTDEFRLSGQVREGRVYTLRAGLASRLRGRKAIRRLAARGKSQGAGTSLRTILRDRNNKQTGRLLTILENEKKAAGRVPGVHVTFSQEGTSDVSIEMQVTENGRDNSLTVTAYGQIKQYV